MSDTATEDTRVLDYTQNPFRLVYEYAITENVPGKVNIHPVTYELRGLDIAASVYTPADYDRDGKFPAITVAHPNGGVKEQTAGVGTPNGWRSRATSRSRQTPHTRARARAHRAASTSPSSAPTTFTAWRISSRASPASTPTV